MLNNIIEYVISVGLTMKDAEYYINNGYTFEDTVNAIEEVNNNLMDFDFDEF
jgi:hypothetical protein